MDTSSAEALVNRDDPIPVINIPARDAASSDSDSRRHKLKESLSPSKLKGKLQDVTSSKSEHSQPLQDRFFTK